MLIKAASHLRPILRLPFLPSSNASSSPFALPSAGSGGTALPPNAFTSNAQLAANQHTQNAYAAAVQAQQLAQVQGQVVLGGAQSGAGAGAGSGFHAGSSRFSGYTGYGRALIQANSSQQTAQRKTDEEDEENDLSNPRSRASLLRRARARRPSVAQTPSDAPQRRTRRFNEAGPNVRFIDVVRDEAQAKRRGLTGAERAALERLEESAIELDELEADIAVLEMGRARSRSNSVDGRTAQVVLAGSVWNVGLGAARTARRNQQAGKDLMRVVRPAGLVRHMSARAVVQLESEAALASAPLLMASAARPTPRAPRATRPRSQSTSALASDSHERSDAVAGMSRDPRPATTDSEEAITAELRATLEAADNQFRRQLNLALKVEDADEQAAAVRALVHQYRNPPAVQQTGQGKPVPTTPPYYTVASYNAVLRGLSTIRAPGGPINEILSAYNEMLERDVLPDIRTYDIVIQALCARHVEIRAVTRSFEERVTWHKWLQSYTRYGMMDRRQHAELAAEEKEIAQLKESVEPLQRESNYESMVRIFDAASVFNRHSRFDDRTYAKLLGLAAERPDVAFAVKVYMHYENHPYSDQKAAVPTYPMYSRLVEAYARATDPKGAIEVMEDLAKNERENPSLAENRMKEIAATSMAWSNLAAAHLVAGDRAAADAIVSQMDQATEESQAEIGTPPLLYPSGLAAILRAELELDPTGQTALVRLQQRVKSPRPLAHAYPALSIIDAGLLRNDFQFSVAALLPAVALLPGGDYSNLVDEFVKRIGFALKLGLKSLCDLQRAQKTQEAESVLTDLLEVAQANASLAVRTPRQRFKFNWTDMHHVVTHLRAAKRDADVLALCAKGGGAVDREDSGMAHYLSQLMAADAPSQENLQTLLGYSVSLADSVTGADKVVGLHLCKVYLKARSSVESPVELGLTDMQWAAVLNAMALDNSSSDGNAQIASIDDMIKLPRDLTQLGLDFAVHQVKRFAVAIARQVGPAETVTLLSPVLAERRVSQLEAILQEALHPASPVPTASEAASVDSTALTTPDSAALSETTRKLNVSIDLSRYIDGARGRPGISPDEAYKALKMNLERDQVPHPQTIGRLIQALSRSGNEDKVRELYALGHRVIAECLTADHQLQAWLSVEDHMLIALCHLGHLEEAGLHRATILEQGGVPSADAYATMISCAKDTTDDASVARELFAESQSLQVQPHLYLYNTIISKLSKARKAEAALELFVKMKAQRVRPSSVTYGAVINACCRVGDAQSATTLFNEMQSMPNFKPRVPPYNTMMQLHLTTEPSRELVLHYYNQMVQRGVPPSAHTYKLLLDAYGTLDPIDLDAMERIFDNLSADSNLSVGSTHWASLINAYGSVAGRVDRAKEIFDSIATHASAIGTHPSAPATGKIDAICWEAILSVFASHKMIDQMEEYSRKMQASGVRGTAYTQNMLIKGYGLVGRIEDARKVFEAMSDGVTGVAAPNNHPALLTSSGQVKPTTSAETEVIFREPSTYETMIRAELLAGHRTEAEALCARMEDRHYPLPVTARIRAVLHESATVHTDALQQVQRSFNATGGSSKKEVYTQQ